MGSVKRRLPWIQFPAIRAQSISKSPLHWCRYISSIAMHYNAHIAHLHMPRIMYDRAIVALFGIDWSIAREMYFSLIEVHVLHCTILRKSNFQLKSSQWNSFWHSMHRFAKDYCVQAARQKAEERQRRIFPLHALFVRNLFSSKCVQHHINSQMDAKSCFFPNISFQLLVCVWN